MHHWITHPTGERKLAFGLLCLLALAIIGLIDYWADYRVLFTILYILPIGFSTLYVNRIFAIFLALLSVAIWVVGDKLAGAPSPGLGIWLWNGGVVFSLYIVVIFLLNALRHALVGLETSVENQTRDLRHEMEERQRLEHEILDLTERERQSFGHELHDIVCQELAGIAIAGHMLAKKLLTKQHKEAEDAREIAVMIDQALTKTRNVARGFFTGGFDMAGLEESLRETIRNIEERKGIRGEIKWDDGLMIANEEVLVHLFRIAQEAIQNAVKYADPTCIEVSLVRLDDKIQMIVSDNGKGMPANIQPEKGLGLRIMAYRAGIIGGEFKLEKPPAGGTRVVCQIPIGKISATREAVAA
jgi:signal transduction histidine kinase